MNPILILLQVLVVWFLIFIGSLLLRLACDLCTGKMPGLGKAQFLALASAVLVVGGFVGLRMAASSIFEEVPGFVALLLNLVLFGVAAAAVSPVAAGLYRAVLDVGSYGRAFRVYFTAFGLHLALIFLVPLSILMSLVAVVYSLLPLHKVPLGYNLRNLQIRWKTTAVTALAFTLVVGILVVMLAFVKGMDKTTQGSAVPGNVMILADGATDEAFSNLPPGASVELLPSAVQKLIEKTPDGKYLATKEVYVIMTHMVPNPQPSGRKRRFVQMRGVEDAEIAAAVHKIDLAAGTWFQGIRKVEVEVDGSKRVETAPEVVLGHGVARTFGSDLGKDTLVPGDVVKIGPRWWYVTGVMSPTSSSFGSEIWTLDRPIQEGFGRKSSYSSYVVRTQSEDLGRKAALALRQDRRERYNAQTEMQYYEKLRGTNDQFRYAIYFIAIVMAVGGVLGIMNTMFAAISQRTKDIGVLRILGYTRFQVLCSFLFESVLIALLGGILGCLVGLLSDGWTATSIVSSGVGGGKSIVLQLVVDGGILAAGILFALVMGAIGGLVPSLSAMRLRPLESLR